MVSHSQSLSLLLDNRDRNMASLSLSIPAGMEGLLELRLDPVELGRVRPAGFAIFQMCFQQVVLVFLIEIIGRGLNVTAGLFV